MKILMHCIYFPPEVGGLESHVYHLCRALAKLGHEVGIVTSASKPGLPPHEVMDGVEVWRTWFPSRSPLGWLAHAAGSVPRSVRAARGADILHAQAFASIPPLQVARGVTGAPLVATFHTSHFLVRAKQPRWRPVLRALVNAGDHVLAASREIADVAQGLAPGTVVDPVTNGVDTGVFRRVEPALAASGSTRRIVVPRRLFPKNGVDVMVRALPLLLEEHADIEMVVIGDGPQRGELERLAGTLGVSSHIRWLGARPNAEMPGLLSSASLAVIPSRMEATSVAALEAMACELPVVASDVGGLPEIVDETVGALTPPDDPAELARTLGRLLRSADLPALGRAARARVVTHWSNDRLAERHLEIYRELVDRRRRRG